MKKCLFCGKEFEKLSEEHIIPNILCGRIKSPNLICENCNSWLGANIDEAFEGVYSQIINLFGIKRERGIPQPIIVESQDSETLYQFSHGGKYDLAEPSCEVEVTPQGAFCFKIEGPLNKKQILNLIGKEFAAKKDEFSKMGIDYKLEIKKRQKYINDNWDTLCQNAHTMKPDVLKFQFVFNDTSVVLAILKIFYFFVKETKPNIIIDDEKIISLLKNKSEKVKDICFYYSLDKDLFEEISDEISHFIKIIGNKKQHKIIGYLKLFSITPYVCILNDDYIGEDFELSYGFNLLSQQTFSPICNEIENLNDLKQQLDYKTNFDTATKQINKDLSRILTLYYKLNPKAKYNELQLRIDKRLRELLSDEIVDKEIVQQSIKFFKNDFEKNISNEVKEKMVEKIVGAIISGIEELLKQNYAISDNQSLTELFPPNRPL